MKRGGFIKRKTPLARGSSQLRRSTRIKPVSDRRRDEEGPEYRTARDAHLAEFPNCQVGPIIRASGFQVYCRGIATHVHHTKGRGRYLCDRSTFLSSCDGGCHPAWIHQTHVAEAKAIGLILPP